MFSEVMTIFGIFFSGFSATAFPFLPALAFFFFFLRLPFSSPGRRMPMVFLGRSITWPYEAFTL